MDLPALYAECAASVHPVTMDRIVRIESGGDPLAINVNRLAGPQPRAGSPTDAARIARHYIGRGHSVDAGVAQVNSRNLAALGYTVEEMFASPCKNLAAGAAILTQCYLRAVPLYGEGQRALHAAASCYNAGDFQRGFTNGYVAKFTGGYTVPALTATNLASALHPASRRVAMTARATRPNPLTADTAVAWGPVNPGWKAE